LVKGTTLGLVKKTILVIQYLLKSTCFKKPRGFFYVVVGGVNGFKVGVVVVAGSCSKLIGKGTMGGERNTYCPPLHCVQTNMEKFV
jgi:hypothetical protein